MMQQHFVEASCYGGSHQTDEEEGASEGKAKTAARTRAMQRTNAEERMGRSNRNPSSGLTRTPTGTIRTQAGQSFLTGVLAEY